ncbi:uncharacterized protein OCT59_017834 [Rhizophagus irregularis]|uniref:Uncharacterized protein n=2 Tax=Rhizophagus irregularis TaxID=588596 RepID=A0A015K6P7_RHIIW|nr:hypothetical protein RirG_119760 [Rhizophagus irregularis DAOM 197198w]UZO25569.1 hypothetical protein OCT59_017834 [Rhizophagus irregularis]GBC46805.1 hypothetical protein RIR_jg20888.t1 [Rhizophagus irregularis DAOM 181602=DAOM 197198]EXX77454.1 hypothetical protein RirG_023560 [Rhizophagus irregularis DAOM 197198w]EXX77457.1 hypothetical protein RirG_023590 [Rhizophagus irregularis DAOM 197198w]
MNIPLVDAPIPPDTVITVENFNLLPPPSVSVPEHLQQFIPTVPIYTGHYQIYSPSGSLEWFQHLHLLLLTSMMLNFIARVCINFQLDIKMLKSYILRMDNLRSEFEELGFEFYKSLRTLNDLPTLDNTKKLGQ